ncbi:hypothetical protein [Pseudomonas citronellolis]|uniref:hypothetical protein n=1 Tax=Pseudomonas citronellolis TaxID=53408 RepID=UPI000B3005F5|nr:hypothetical protein [Pseudomonas citronellolis]
MGTFIKKTKKLILHPKKFFIDRQRKIDAAKQQVLAPKKSQPASVHSKPNPSHKLYVNSSFTDSDKLFQHAKGILEKYAMLKIDDYRFAKTDIVFDISGKVYVAELSSPVENNILVKGFLLVTPKDTIESGSNKLDAVFLDLLHKINVDHMKSVSDFNLLYKYYDDRPERNEQSQVKYALSAGIYEKDIISKALVLLEGSSVNLAPKDVMFVFKKIYRVLGVDQRLEAIANRLAISIKKESYPTDFIMLLAAFFTESGDFKRALEMASNAKSADLGMV